MLSFTLSNNFKSSVIKLLKFLFYFSLIINITTCLLLILHLFFNKEVRLVLILISSLSAIFFILGLFFYENYLIVTISDFRFFLKSLFSFFLLLFPSIAFTFRYSFNGVLKPYINFFSGAIIIYTFFQMPFRKNYNILDNIIAELLFHVRYIMIDFWKENRNPLIVKNSIKEVRESYYSNFHDLQIFQQTLTCATPDAQCALRLISSQWQKENISILDIGGGDGIFTKILLEGLKERGISFSKILMIDPASWELTYKKNLSSLIPKERIEVQNTTFRDFEKRGKIFDLVIASHSLYAEFDYYFNQKEDIYTQIITPLKALVKKGGIIIITMASMKGISYRFKKQSIELLFGKTVVDATSEIVWQVLQNEREKIDYLCSDSTFYLTDLWNKYKAKNEEPLYSWLSYFLRFDIKSLSELEKCMIIEYLNNNLLRFDRLPNCQKEIYRKNQIINYTDSSWILPHKVEIFRYNG